LIYNMLKMNANTKNTISVIHLLSLIPSEDLNRIAERTNVNRYIKVLDGQSVLYLLLYALVECQRNSLRTMQDIFNSAAYKFLFNLPFGKTVKYNSISERLSLINPEFFKQAYELIFEIFSEHYCKQEIEERHLIRVDSTMVAEAANKLKKGIEVGRKRKITKSNPTSKKQIKYTFAFNGSFPCLAEAFTDKTYASESIAVPEVIYKYAEKSKAAVFVFDRGMERREVFENLTENQTLFITRIKSSSRYRIITQIEKGDGREIGTLELDSDLEVYISVKRSHL